MRISLCNEVVRELDFAAQCALAKGLGYDGLELAPFTLSDEPERLPYNRRAELRKIADDHGPRSPGCTGSSWCPRVSRSPAPTTPIGCARSR